MKETWRVGRRGGDVPLPHWLALRRRLDAIGWAAWAVAPRRPAPPASGGAGIAGPGIGSAGGARGFWGCVRTRWSQAAGPLPSGLRPRGAARAAGRWGGAGRGRAKPGHGGRWRSRRTGACTDRPRRASRAVFSFPSDYCFGFFCRREFWLIYFTHQFWLEVKRRMRSGVICR